MTNDEWPMTKEARISKPQFRINDEIRMPNADSPLRRGGAEHAGRLHSGTHRLRRRLGLLPSGEGLAIAIHSRAADSHLAGDGLPLHAAVSQLLHALQKGFPLRDKGPAHFLGQLAVASMGHWLDAMR